MIRKPLVLLLSCLLIFVTLPVESSHAANAAVAKLPGNSNPLIDHKLGADPYVLVHNNRVYVYMTGDAYLYNSDGSVRENQYSTIGKINVISSADMVNWTDHGSIPVAGANNANNGQGIAKWATQSWAPAMAKKTIAGRESFSCILPTRVEVLACSRRIPPIGPWSDPLGRALLTHSTPGMSGVTWLAS